MYGIRIRYFTDIYKRIYILENIKEAFVWEIKSIFLGIENGK